MAVFNVRLTKQEIKKQKDLLKRFQRYLPTLTLKMQQLKLSLNRIEAKLRAKEMEREYYVKIRAEWLHVFGESVDLSDYFAIDTVTLNHENLAGITIPNVVCVNFSQNQWDVHDNPLWIDAGIHYMKELIQMDAEIVILNMQRETVREELRITTQRVNLFEKIRIPQTKQTIKQIAIYLGDQHTAAVVRGKIAKQKLQRA